MRQDYIYLIRRFKEDSMLQELRTEIEKERERQKKLLTKKDQLDRQVKTLLEDSVTLLKARMCELDIEVSAPSQLLAKAKEIVLRHKELQARSSSLDRDVAFFEEQQRNLILVRQQHQVHTDNLCRFRVITLSKRLLYRDKETRSNIVLMGAHRDYLRRKSAFDIDPFIWYDCTVFA